MDTYVFELKKIASNLGGYLHFDDAGYLRGLSWEAESAFNSGEVTGRIAATIIYQQVIEELLLNLLRLSEVFVQISIFPQKIEIKPNDEIMFGTLINEFNRFCMEFKEKGALVGSCRKFNDVRRLVAHQLASEANERAVINRTDEINELYQEIFDLWSKGAKFMYYELEERLKTSNIV